MDSPTSPKRRSKKRTRSTFDVHAVSESTGSLAEHVSSVVLSQFPKSSFRTHQHAFCNSISALRGVRSAVTESENPIVLSAIANPALKRSLMKWCERNDVPHFSLLDGVIDFFSGSIGKRPVRDASRVHRCNEDYFRRIDAWEFTLQHDDNRRIETIGQADIVLVGVSRVGKTPLAAYLGSLGYRVANIAIAPESRIPREIAACRKKTVGLTLQPRRLVRIRERRFELNRFKDALSRLSDSPHQYLSPQTAIRDLMFAESAFRKLKVPILDVTDLTVEESAAHVLDLLKLKT